MEKAGARLSKIARNSAGNLWHVIDLHFQNTSFAYTWIVQW